MHQFVHINGYGLHLAATRKKEAHTLGQVFREMLREQGFYGHLSNPRPPIRVTGNDPHTLLSWVERQHARQTVGGRHLRKDCWVALVGVTSWPVQAAKVRSSMAEVERFKAWQKLDVAWLRRQFPHAAAFSVVLHTDENFLHHHFIVVAEHLSLTMDMHPGHRAKRLARAAGRDTAAANWAYCDAMRAWQDSYQGEVAGALGLKRISDAPRRRRSTAAVRAAVASGEWTPGVGPVRERNALVNGRAE